VSIADEVQSLDAAIGGPVDYDDAVELEIRDQDGANRHLRHVARIRRELADAEMVIAAELERINAWAEERRARAAREEAWHLGILEHYARACLALNPKLKTTKLPEGELRLRAQEPEWEFSDEFRDWCLEHRPDLLHPEAPPPPRKVAAVAAKKALTVEVKDDRDRVIDRIYGYIEGTDGTAPPGVKVDVRDEKFDIVLTEG
jgi:hypothetical protein